MSESTNEQSATEGAVAPAEAVQEQQATETQDSVDTAPAATETAEETPQPDAPAKPRGADRRFAHLTAKLAAEAADKARLENELAAARALIASRTEPEYDAQEQPARQPANEIEFRAQQIAAERVLNERMGAIAAKGIKDNGQESWNEKTQFLYQQGATRNPAFLEALAEQENAHRIVDYLFDSPDEIVSIMSKGPAGMGAALTRLDAKVATQATGARISNAPTPAPRAATGNVRPEPTIYDSTLSMKEWAELWDKQAPPHLGGRRRTAA